MFHSKNPSKKFHSNNSSKQPSCKLFVGNLATHTTSTHLQTIFHSHGQIIECVKVRERYGFVRFSNTDDAQRALNACNGLQLNGYPMIVEYAQNEILISPKSPRMSSRYYSKKEDIPILKYPSSNLNPDASSFVVPSSTSDYHSQSDRPSSRSSSDRSNCISPALLSSTFPFSYSDDDEGISEEKISRKKIQDKPINLAIGEKILHLYRSNVDMNNNPIFNSFNGKGSLEEEEALIDVSLRSGY